MLRYPFCLTAFVLLLITLSAPTLLGKTLEQQLQAIDPQQLAVEAKQLGDAKRGAILFYQPQMACRSCHAMDDQALLGPDLTQWKKLPSDADLVDAILSPSKQIREGFEAVSILTVHGKVITGRQVESTPEQVVLQELTGAQQRHTIPTDDIEAQTAGKQSLMPAGLANQLSSRQQFLDLVRYLIKVRDGGRIAARNLEPAPHLYAVKPVPEYEKRIDHAGLIADLNDASFKRGEAIYTRVCANCHGTHDKAGSLPTSPRFASAKLKNRIDPHGMYQTLTHGFGMMQPQGWMVPQQKYDVIHYIREAYFKPNNPAQYAKVDDTYLKSLPTGDFRGPDPSPMQPWITMDYGPSLINTYEVGNDGSNFAYKGIATRLDDGTGGVSRGSRWMIFDHDTMRMAAAWQGKGFIDWQGIHFDGKHGVHPHIVGQVLAANKTAPGWANPEDGSFADPRVLGRDGRRYGPLPSSWAKYHGLYRHGNDRIISYSVGKAEILEMPQLLVDTPAVFARHFEIAPHDHKLVMRVADLPGGFYDQSELAKWKSDDSAYVVQAGKDAAPKSEGLKFDGATSVQIKTGDAFDMTKSDFSISARIRTKLGGPIFAQTTPDPKWVPDGKVFFVRGGKLCYDIGWVGVVTSKTSVNDDKWHDVAMTWDQTTGIASLWIDGKLDAQKELRPKQTLKGTVVRMGYASPNFPDPGKYQGEIESLRFYSEKLSPEAIGDFTSQPRPVPLWHSDVLPKGNLFTPSKEKLEAEIIRGARQSFARNYLIAGLKNPPSAAAFRIAGKALLLDLPASDKPAKFTLWFTSAEEAKDVDQIVNAVKLTSGDTPDLKMATQGTPARWTEVLETKTVPGTEGGPFAADVLTLPDNNPWNAQMRLTGFDFYPGSDRAAVCAWDGDVWLVDGLMANDGALRWRRIASGLFQPLGLKIVNGAIYVTCRDQIVILRDLNGDLETDYYECFNNDHQVTEHFHEFAMGLQVDDDGNFYYAKSARHALTAVVPHHGTLLRVSPDGSKTDILATGFRAANGVCLNPDGTFVVTDQEGHWNPKNRINWVEPGGFYGNMYGYHDVTDESDDAMVPPLVWITNEFDRSPAELLWVPKDCWGNLGGSLLNLSYGYGKVYIVPFETVDGVKQGGMCELPLPQFPTGIARGRFSPADGQLYACGMFAWGSNQQQPGGFYRIRRTEQSVYLPIGLNATIDGVQMTFSGKLDPATATNPDNYAITAWNLLRSKNYGSKHLNERPWKVSAAKLSADGTTVALTLPEIEPTWGMEIRCFLKSAEGKPVEVRIHNTIHRLKESDAAN
ncbi:heme-binding protein [Blastopirellula marina]|uniref:Heme-binding protein n=1 Tax=Blastopirellula marina TaxID=124 RepID=A0A2S8FMI2_9BACT|nr:MULTISPECIES: DUF6797 domain-containing protein [Pirellulaceae]PQO33399.1 heme-binding protein [Blastopirellula marina]RCS52488.1 heme-binding protein [Bremerella cremea]